MSLSSAEHLPILGSRYRLTRTLQSGEGVRTALARDVESGVNVVVKMVRAESVTSEELDRIRAEIRAGQGLSAPFLVPLERSGTDADHFFTVASLALGQPLGERVRDGPLPIRDVLAVATSVLRALERLHERGFAHLNMRPSKIILSPGDPVRNAVLLPSGLIRTSRSRQLRHDAPNDLLRFAAPEQLRLIDRDVDPRSDLYSTGVLLFSCVAGRCPFDGETVVDALRRAAVSTAEPLRYVRPAVPRALEEFVRRLLSKDPEDRYQSAASALADVQLLCDALAGGAKDPALVLGRQDRRNHLTEPSLVGRSHELEVLDGKLNDLAEGRGGLVVIAGVSGVGKSRMLRELRSMGESRGFVVFEGSRLEPGKRRPAGAFSGVVSDTLAHINRNPDYLDELKSRIPTIGQESVTILPELGPVLGHVDGKSAWDEELGRRGSVRGLATFLSALGSPEAPALVLVDDVQWADDLTLAILTDWHRTCPPRSHVMVVVATRSDELAQRELDIPPLSTRLRLSELKPDEVRALVESSAGQIPDPGYRVIEAWAEGNPFMVMAGLRGLVEAGALTPDDSGWRLNHAKLDAARVGSSAASVLSRRLDLLTEHTLRMLFAAATLGTRFDVATVSRLIGRVESSVESSIAEAMKAHLIFVSQGAYAFVHHRVREAVLEKLSAEERRRMHRAVALDLEARDPSRAFDLAYHFDASGDHSSAVAYALPAAREARRRYALDLAEELYRLASHAENELSRAHQREIVGGLGVIFKLTGGYPEAIERIEHFRSLADDEADLAWVDAELGELALKQGRTQQARAHLESAIRLCGGRIPRRPIWQALGCLWELLVRLLYLTGFPKLWQTPGSKHRRTSEIRLAQLYQRLLHALWFDASSMLTLWADLRQLNCAHRVGDLRTRARALATHAAPSSAILPILSRIGMRQIDQAMRSQERILDQRGGARSLQYRGVVLYTAGRYSESVASLDEALRHLDGIGDLWEANMAQWLRAMTLYRMGKLEEAGATSRQTLEAALRIGDRQAAAISLATMAKTVDRPATLEIHARSDAEPDGDVFTEVSLLQAEGIQRLSGGELDAGADALMQAVRRLTRSGLVNVFTAPTFVWLATAHRLVAESLPPRGQRAALRRASRSARRALAVAVVYRHDLPHALREAALVTALRGHERRARFLLRRSLAAARRTCAAHEENLSARALASLDEPEVARVRPVTPELVEEAAWPQDLDGRAHAADMQRHEALLQAARALTGAGSQGALVEALCETAVALLRAEQCTLLVADGGTSAEAGLWKLGGDLPDSVDRDVMLRAQSLGHPVAAELEAGATLDLRSALYAPIVVRGTQVACLRAVHRSINGMFGDEEVRLAAFLTALTGAALERMQLQDELMSRVISAQEAERARVSRDLHDEVGQGLTTLLLGLGQLESGPQDPRCTRDRVGELRTTIGHLLTQVRRLAFDLRPTVLDDLGLDAALRRLADDISTRYTVTVDMEARSLARVPRLPPNLETTLYRVAQEALTNVVRHSDAKECSVVVGRDGSSLRLIIEDDGRGFDAAKTSPGSLGIRGMQERASLVGGALTVTSSCGVGTTVMLEVPI